MKSSFASRWVKVGTGLCWQTLLAILLSGAGIFMLVGGTLNLLGYGLINETGPAIGYLLLGLVLSIFGILFITFVYQAVRYQIPAILALQKLASLSDSAELSELGSRLAFAIRHCERPLGETSTTGLICELVQRFSTLRPDLLAPAVCDEKMRRFEGEEANLKALLQQHSELKAKLRKQNVVSKLLAGVFGNAMLFHSISTAEESELEPITKAIATAKMNLVRMDRKFSDAVADAIEKNMQAAAVGNPVSGGGHHKDVR